MRRDESLLMDILVAARKAIRVTQGMTRDDFAANDVVQDSVIRQIEIMGEAARQVSEAFRELHNEIPWHEIRGMRNRLIHDYKRIDLDEVWKTLRVDIPALIHLLEPLIPPEDSL
ncbi:DUF86 domain-containing protein [candidate division KSB1 bacterium]|nr:MAG: DUF86 domain-containing protein [candidate division KSB1 bacterium]